MNAGPHQGFFADRVAEAIGQARDGTLGRQILEALAEGPCLVDDLLDRFYEGGDRHDARNAVRWHRQKMSKVLRDLGLEIATTRPDGGPGSVWVLREIDPGEAGGRLRHAGRRIDWRAEGAGNALFASLAQEFDALPAGFFLVYHLGIQRPAVSLARAAGGIAALSGGTLASWPEDPPIIDPRRWSYAIQKPAVVGKSFCAGGA